MKNLYDKLRIFPKIFCARFLSDKTADLSSVETTTQFDSVRPPLTAVDSTAVDGVGLNATETLYLM